MSREPADPQRKKRFPVTLETVNKPQHRPVSKNGAGFTTQSSLTQVAGMDSRQAVSIQQHPFTEATPVAGNMDALRVRMVQRLRQSGMDDVRVLEAMRQVPRHLFVDTALVNQAYEDTSLPIGLGQTISKPSVVARMLALALPAAGGGMLGRVLEIGTGGGYQAAVLSQLANEVYSIERIKALHERARVNLRPFRLKNVHLIYGDGMQGFAAGAPYEAIVAAASGNEPPSAWLEQLAVGGVLVAPVQSNAGVQALVKVERTGWQEWRQYVLEAVQFVPLKSGTS